MKLLSTTQGRITVEIARLGLDIQNTLAFNEKPFLVRAKYSFEPELRPLEDDPGCPEWFAFDTLYCCQDTEFVTECGLVVIVKPRVDLLEVLDLGQLYNIEDIVRKAVLEERYVY